MAHIIDLDQQAIDRVTSIGAPDPQQSAAAVWPVAALGRLLAANRQRGMVTVEFIFGTLVCIAIVTIVATMLHDPKMATFFADVFKKLVSMIFDR